MQTHADEFFAISVNRESSRIAAEILNPTKTRNVDERYFTAVTIAEIATADMRTGRNFTTTKLMTPEGNHGTKAASTRENCREKLSSTFSPFASDIPVELSIYSAFPHPRPCWI